MKQSHVKLLLLCIFSGLILSVLYMHSQSADWNRYGKELEILRDVRLQNALVNQEILKIRYRLFSNYDQLEQYTLQLRKLITDLHKSTSTNNSPLSGKMLRHIAGLQKQLIDKLEFQEQFKSLNAIFKNSLIRLPTLTKEFDIKLAAESETEVMSKYLNNLTQDVLLYSLINDNKLDAALKEKIKTISTHKTSDAKLASYYQNVGQHATFILRKRNEANSILSSVLAVPIEQTTRELQKYYAELHYRNTFKSDTFRKALYFVSIILLIYTAFIFAKLNQKRQALSREKERAQITLQSIGDGVITTDAKGIIQFINPIAEQLTLWTNIESKGKRLIEIFRVFDEITKMKIDGPVQRCVEEKRRIVSAAQSMLINRNNQPIAIEESVAPIMDNNNNVVGTIIVFRDVSHTRELSQRLLKQASHDALTGVINRRGFDHALESLIAQARLESKVHALLYIDLDQFKVVNDTCGHNAGDQLLVQITDLIQKRMQKRNLLARLGGDEFGILLKNYSLLSAKRCAEDLLKAIKQFRFEWQGISFQIGASIGLATINHKSENAATLLSAADMACYLAKDLGRNRVHVYNNSDHQLVRRQGEMEWVAKLAEAYKNNRFVLYRQAILPALGGDDKVKHYELLIRLRDQGGQLISPDAFIPAAERYNYMPTIDRWVIHTALSQHRWFASDDCYSINLSGTTLNSENIVQYIRQEISKSSLTAKQICFEITETAAINNLDAAAAMIVDLKKLGFRFALDDFGKGLSSYTYLYNLPVDYLKIDGEFVRDLNSNPVFYEIIRSVNKIGHLLGMQTIAEYVEDETILATLRTIGIDFVQGYNFGLPEPLNATMREDITEDSISAKYPALQI